MNNLVIIAVGCMNDHNHCIVHFAKVFEYVVDVSATHLPSLLSKNFK